MAIQLRKYARPRIQRAFLKWWSKNRTDFQVPVRLASVTHKGIRLNFFPPHDCVHACLTSCNLNIVVESNHEFLDLLLSLDAYPARVNGVYQCMLCLDNLKFWTSREALWIDHLFDPFILWVNDHLGKSIGVKLEKLEVNLNLAKLIY